MSSLFAVMVGITAAAGVARYLIRSPVVQNMKPRAPRFEQGGFLKTMTHEEAAKILGVRQSWNKQRIIQTHRKIMQINHPDNGGSTYLATKINEAKDLLTKDNSPRIDPQ